MISRLYFLSILIGLARRSHANIKGGQTICLDLSRHLPSVALDGYRRSCFEKTRLDSRSSSSVSIQKSIGKCCWYLVLLCVWMACSEGCNYRLMNRLMFVLGCYIQYFWLFNMDIV